MQKTIQQQGITVHLSLPPIFPTMTEPDRVQVLQWHVQEGAIVRRGNPLLEVACCYGNIEIPMPPFLIGSYCVSHIVKKLNEEMVLGDLFLVLEKIETAKASVHKDSQEKHNLA